MPDPQGNAQNIKNEKQKTSRDWIYIYYNAARRYRLGYHYSGNSKVN